MLAVCLMVVVGCADKPKEEFRPPVSAEQMVPVLADIHLLEARADMLRLPDDTMARIVDSAYQVLYKKFDIQEADFQATFKYYEAHPDKMDALYQAVVDELIKREAALTGVKREAPEGLVKK